MLKHVRPSCRRVLFRRMNCDPDSHSPNSAVSLCYKIGNYVSCWLKPRKGRPSFWPVLTFKCSHFVYSIKIVLLRFVGATRSSAFSSALCLFLRRNRQEGWGKPTVHYLPSHQRSTFMLHLACYLGLREKWLIRRLCWCSIMMTMEVKAICYSEILVSD